MSLQRFHETQASASTGYDTALEEIRRGRKTSHWIWYIFPQLDGLGRSSTARAYPLLRARYEEIAGAVSEQLARGRAVEELMGSSIDALKLASSLTLFGVAAQSLTREDPSFDSLARACDSILALTGAQGCPPSLQTLTQLHIVFTPDQNDN